MTLTVDNVLVWMKKTNILIQEHKDELTALDQPIGDGDHGVNVAQGFQKVTETLEGKTYQTVSDVLKDIATTLISTVGGASGPLLGTAFLKMSTALKDQTVVNHEDFSHALQAAVSGIKQRGRATTGEKTMIDVWQPVSDYMTETTDFSAAEMADIAESAAAQTRDIQATKGRAAYFAEQSVGHLDPGAVTTSYMMKALAKSL